MKEGWLAVDVKDRAKYIYVCHQPLRDDSDSITGSHHNLEQT